MDADTGALTGICDWAEVEISPFGMSLGAVENILGIPTMDPSGRNDHIYHTNHQELRDLLYNELYHAMGSTSDDDKKRIEDARLIGLFLTNGWRYDAAGNQLCAGEEDHGLHHLDAVLRATYSKRCSPLAPRPHVTASTWYAHITKTVETPQARDSTTDQGHK